jgi:2-polyprenyl-3-methyl-5-hydroxy-6-metoxy-1,4-benzoquinol methylase
VNVLEWLRHRGSATQSEVSPTAAHAVPVDFPHCIAQEFPDGFAVAWQATRDVLDAIAHHDVTALERRSPGLRGYDWKGYLECSVARLVRVAQQIKIRGVSGRLLDIGAYFGNASLMCRRMGFEVDALDAYAAYESALIPSTTLLASAGVRVRDFVEAGSDLTQLEDESYGAVLCLGVIEHVPHTPKPLLAAIRRVLRPGGVLVLDTPNIAYLYNRRRLMRGESIMAPIATQFDSEIPFEGHHREYSPDEIEWMLQRVGFGDVTLETFNYSYYALSELAGDDLECHRLMQADPSARELVLAVARKPHA